MPRDVGVIVVAAGRGSRLGASVPKQYLPVAGVPVLLRAIRPFVAHPDVRQVIAVLPADDVAAPPDWLAGLTGEAFSLVAGGATRQDSVAAGLGALDPSCAIVLVHDGARPFPPREAIDGGIAAARDGHAAVPAVPLADTLKRADDCGTVLGTVPRAGLWRAQTPQAFPRALLARAHAAAPTHAVEITDDAMLVELVGGRVDLLPGSARNLKITRPDDLEFAEWLAGRP
ncbi:MAG: 2-C-methyl-D-erythritol 4-phosphate cytidylyltransferase [Gemmatimonadetes bacterium]|nr:2-C-methyl-D-erythritol 4-phosphate cytidylyltransferase [Gemmatimonadota bacterium]MCB9517542.1 2-C-methyl-D-erythritol 4-phosphate cytidylyltransferase [Gemmatimonadales bacterium]MCA9761501.1 2-C-methyl-D-erythritol 4-phosphate cytidylyltransferase [Gemmatimonadota bacterium]MCA9767706.1 2-C-methyl-D-erythritol 4-phosphate cytidylyltransferase [Gemmatimonadota bacterium]HPF60829.1 2-C-methyl-D-erythritol 4-phosphate cytidylyltransferase [Gemmatimonadales bacterium]